MCTMLGALTLTCCGNGPQCTPDQMRERIAATRDLREAEHHMRCAEREGPPNPRLLAACEGLADARARMGDDCLSADAIRARLARGSLAGQPRVPVLHLAELDWVALAPPAARWRGAPCTADLQCLSGVVLLFPCWVALDAVAATPQAALCALAWVERRVGPSFAAASRERVQAPVGVPGGPVGAWGFTVGMHALVWARVALCASHWVQAGGSRLAPFARAIGLPAAYVRAIVNALTTGEGNPG